MDYMDKIAMRQDRQLAAAEFIALYSIPDVAGFPNEEITPGEYAVQMNEKEQKCARKCKLVDIIILLNNIPDSDRSKKYIETELGKAFAEIVNEAGWIELLEEIIEEREIRNA